VSGPTLELTPWQRAELLAYADGSPRRAEARPSANLIRRNMLELAPASGQGFYRITQFGLAALRAADAASPQEAQEAQEAHAMAMGEAISRVWQALDVIHESPHLTRADLHEIVGQARSSWTPPEPTS
jgi:hypothetical protein